VEWSEFSKPASDQLRIAQTALETTSVHGGRYTLCSVPRDRSLTLRARSADSRTVSAQRAMRAGEVRRVDLTLHAP
jgi:hypothetical protein